MGKKVIDLPNNMLYQFDDNRYVWKVELANTRNGNYSNPKRLFTEVYELNGNNMLDLVVSGRLIDNPSAIKEDEFAIFDYDMDNTISFKVTKPLTRASIDKVYLLRDAINRRYQETKKRKN